MTYKHYSIILILLMIFGLVFWLIMPEFNRLAEMKKQIQSAGDDQESLVKYYNKIDSLADEIEKYKEEASYIRSAIPKEADIESLVSFTQKISFENGVMIKTMQIGKPQQNDKNKDLYQTDFNLEVSGSYFAFKNFLSRLERSARFIEIKNISFASTGKADKLPSYRMNLRIYSY